MRKRCRETNIEFHGTAIVKETYTPLSFATCLTACALQQHATSRARVDCDAMHSMRCNIKQLRVTLENRAYARRCCSGGWPPRQHITDVAHRAEQTYDRLRKDPKAQLGFAPFEFVVDAPLAACSH